MDNIKLVALRVPMELYNKIRDLSRHEYRPLSQQILMLIDKGMKCRELHENKKDDNIIT